MVMRVNNFFPVRHCLRLFFYSLSHKSYFSPSSLLGLPNYEVSNAFLSTTRSVCMVRQHLEPIVADKSPGHGHGAEYPGEG